MRANLCTLLGVAAASALVVAASPGLSTGLGRRVSAGPEAAPRAKISSRRPNSVPSPRSLLAARRPTLKLLDRRRPAVTPRALFGSPEDALGLHEATQHAASVVSSSSPALLTSVADAVANAVGTVGEATQTILDSSAANQGALDAVKDSAETAVTQAAASSPGWLKPWTDILEQVLATIERNLHAAGIPYSYGWSIILLTLFVKTVTYPLTKQQVESTLKMQLVKPSIDKIKETYERNPEIIEREREVLYEEYEVNPSASLFPTIATIPILLGLFYTLRNVAGQGLLDDQGFFWIPTLGGPATFADRQAGTGLAWLWPFVDGHPPIGWDKAIRYMVLPISLVLAQLLSSQVLNSLQKKKTEESKGSLMSLTIKNPDGTTEVIQGEEEEEDEDKKKAKEAAERTGKILGYVLPLVVGYFSLNVPSGLALYYLSNTLISTAQQLYLREFGGIELEELDVGDLPPGYAIRTGEPVDPTDGDMTDEEVEAMIPDWFRKVQEGDESAWPLWDKLYGEGEYERLFYGPKCYGYNPDIMISEFSEELEMAGPPDLENIDDPYPGFAELINDGEEEGEYDDLFEDPDIR